MQTSSHDFNVILKPLFIKLQTITNNSKLLLS
nr:MAG TPA: hypothetical protein [Inoviridae sp.]DAR16490.1 MAG TPA: hypothetical protein [Caudoviricetes sp.]